MQLVLNTSLIQCKVFSYVHTCVRIHTLLHSLYNQRHSYLHLERRNYHSFLSLKVPSVTVQGPATDATDIFDYPGHNFLRGQVHHNFVKSLVL